MKTGWTERQVDEMTRGAFFRFLDEGKSPEDETERGVKVSSFDEARRLGII